jgi:hypothetical protein
MLFEPHIEAYEHQAKGIQKKGHGPAQFLPEDSS